MEIVEIECAGVSDYGLARTSRAFRSIAAEGHVFRLDERLFYADLAEQLSSLLTWRILMADKLLSEAEDDDEPARVLPRECGVGWPGTANDRGGLTRG